MNKEKPDMILYTTEDGLTNFATTASNEKTCRVDYYKLDVIISVGYRVRSKRGTQFRIWATEILKEYMRKGFALDDVRLKNLGGGGYCKELLERIRDIRVSEKVFYRQVLEIYAKDIEGSHWESWFRKRLFGCHKNIGAKNEQGIKWLEFSEMRK